MPTLDLPPCSQCGYPFWGVYHDSDTRDYYFLVGPEALIELDGDSGDAGDAIWCATCELTPDQATFDHVHDTWARAIASAFVSDMDADDALFEAGRAAREEWEARSSAPA